MKPTSKKLGRPNKLGKSALRAFRIGDSTYDMLLHFAAKNGVSASEALRLIIVRQLANPANPY